MTKHPDGALEDAAKRQADRIDRIDRIGPAGRDWRWWREYRDAYAEGVGVNRESPEPLTRELMQYLSSLDRKILALRKERNRE